MNQPNWTAGKVAGGLSFGRTDDFVKVKDSSVGSLNLGTSDFTIAAWVQTPSSFWGSDRFLVVVARASSISYGDNNTNGWGLLIGNNNRVSLALPGLNPDDFVSDAGTLATDTWHHVAAAYNAALNEVTYYLDGTQLGAKRPLVTPAAWIIIWTSGLAPSLMMADSPFRGFLTKLEFINGPLLPKKYRPWQLQE
jgi:hypothetical protein